MLSEKLVQSVRVGAAGSLQSGEHIVVVASALVGEMSTKKMFGQAMLVSAATLGTITAFTKPRKMFLALTDRRLLFFAGNDVTGRSTDKLVMEIPREALRTQETRVKKVMLAIPTLVVELAVAGSDKGLKLQFPTPCRDEGQEIATAVGHA